MDRATAGSAASRHRNISPGRHGRGTTVLQEGEKLLRWLVWPAFFLFSLSAGAAPLDGAFAEWLSTRSANNVAYRELAARFLAAAGRDATGYRETMERLEGGFRTFLAKRGNPDDPRQRLEALAEFFFVKHGFQVDLDLSEGALTLQLNKRGRFAR